MDESVARERLTAERDEVAQLLKGTVSAGEQDREVEVDETGDYADSAQPLTAQGMDDAIAEGLQDRMAAIGRALARLDDGTYGLSVLSGDRIPDAGWRPIPRPSSPSRKRRRPRPAPAKSGAGAATRPDRAGHPA